MSKLTVLFLLTVLELLAISRMPFLRSLRSSQSVIRLRFASKFLTSQPIPLRAVP